MEIKIFENPEFGQIRTTVMEDGQVMFVGKDVAIVLGYKDSVNAIKTHVEGSDKLGWQITTLGQRRRVTLINESGLYALVLSSKLPQARDFKHWVTSEVLPRIRRTGGYIPVSDKDDETTILYKSLNILKRTIEQKNALIEMQRPKVAFADAVIASKEVCTIADLAKMIASHGVPIGQNRLFKWLRDNRYLGATEHHWNVPLQLWVETGLFQLKVSSPWVDSDGETHYKIVPMVTPKGQMFFINLFLNQ